MTVTTGEAAHPRTGQERLLAALRANLVAYQAGVAEAFLAVPRHLFLPGIPADEAYRDLPFVTKQDADGLAVSSSSQPSTMAMMLDMLGLRPGMRVLEIGAGTGYNAALMAHITGPGGSVVTVDIDGDVVLSARRNLASAGFDQVTVLHADGTAGSPEHAPFDRIIVTAGTGEIFPAWAGQLAAAGRIVMPLTLRIVQRVVAFEKDEGFLRGTAVRDCGFMGGFICLTGSGSGPERTYALPGKPGVHLRAAGGTGLDPAAVSAALDRPRAAAPVGVRVKLMDVIRGLGLWLALADPRLASFFAEDAEGTAAGDLVPALLAFPGYRGTAGLAERGGLAYLVPDQPGAAEFALLAAGAGAGADRLVTALTEHVRAWHARGRPGTSGLRVAAYPAGHPGPERHEFVISKQHVRLGVGWPQPPAR